MPLMGVRPRTQHATSIIRVTQTATQNSSGIPSGLSRSGILRQARNSLTTMSTRSMTSLQRLPLWCEALLWLYPGSSLLGPHQADNASVTSLPGAWEDSPYACRLWRDRGIIVLLLILPSALYTVVNVSHTASASWSQSHSRIAYRARAPLRIDRINCCHELLGSSRSFWSKRCAWI